MLIYLGRKLLDPKLEQTWCIAPKTTMWQEFIKVKFDNLTSCHIRTCRKNWVPFRV